jgi:hypothetical protein
MRRAGKTRRCARCGKRTAVPAALHRARCAGAKGGPLSGLKKEYTAAELAEVAVPLPRTVRRMRVPSLVPDSSKWECFECGQVIGKKRVCNFCGYDRGKD